ncbi:unnamed protein product [Rotaria socialis]|uniref:Uncharacterized protein n=1 Tax=Rotaria socialis TaxID=392032 RepID=A0A818F479_9BILA|nr:unnamed protein product [Rotaria socialis]
MGSGPSSSSSNSSSEIRLSEKPDIRNFGTIVKISIYGNGLVHGGFWFGTHHVFSVLQTEKDCVEINQEQSESEITDVFVIDQEQSIYNNYRICSGIDEEESI